MRLHFGLSTAAKADKIEIRWPSGQTSLFQNVAADHFYLLTEGDSTPKLER
jgi:hypothetical protein